ncbi:MAG: hypothetical protein QGG40_03650 [Myxococcota bacterium]|jgi:hypothetical protein|nr:hypothetical protein [Myxococcota bacterium]
MLWILAGMSQVLAGTLTCPTPYDNPALATRLHEAEQAFGTLDLEGFDRARDDASVMLPCLGEVIEPGVAASFHRLRGIAWYLAGDGSNAERSFAASRALDPDLGLPLELVPAGHAMREVFDAVALDNPTWEPLPAPRTARVYLDGREGPRRSRTWPSIIQVVDEDGSLQQTAYVWPDEAAPRYEVREPVATEAVQVPSVDMAGETFTPEPSEGPGRLVWGGGLTLGGGVVLAAVGYGQARVTAGKLDRAPEAQAWETYEDGESAYALGSTLYWTGGALGLAGGLVLGAGLLVPSGHVTVTNHGIAVVLPW